MCCFVFSLAVWCVCLIHPIRFSVSFLRHIPRGPSFSATHVDACWIQPGIWSICFKEKTLKIGPIIYKAIESGWPGVVSPASCPSCLLQGPSIQLYWATFQAPWISKALSCQGTFTWSALFSLKPNCLQALPLLWNLPKQNWSLPPVPPLYLAHSLC